MPNLENQSFEIAPPCPCSELIAALSKVPDVVLRAGGSEQDIVEIETAAHDPNCVAQKRPEDYPCGNKEWVCGRSDNKNMLIIAAKLTLNETLSLQEIKDLFE